MNIDGPYPLKIPTNTFKHVPCITAEHVNTSLFLLISLPVANMALFLLLSRRKMSILSCLKPVGLLPITVHPLKNVNSFWAVDYLVSMICL